MGGVDFKLKSRSHMQATYRQRVHYVKSGGDVFLFTHPHQNPGSANLDKLELLKVFARDTYKECAVVVQPGGDKGMTFPVAGRERPKFGDITEVEEGRFADVMIGHMQATAIVNDFNN